MYTLYYYPNNASLAPHFLLHKIGTEYELKLVDRKSNAQKSSGYLELNPTGRIPTLVDASLVLFESPAICIYLCEQNPEAELMPPLGGIDRPLFYQWLAFLNNTLQAELMIYIYPGKHTTDKSSVHNIKEAQEIRIAEVLSVIEAQLENNEFILGKKLSACDYFFFMLAEWTLSLNYSVLNYSNLKDYLKRMSHDSTIIAVCEIEGIDLTVFQNNL